MWPINTAVSRKSGGAITSPQWRPSRAVFLSSRGVAERARGGAYREVVGGQGQRRCASRRLGALTTLLAAFPGGDLPEHARQGIISPPARGEVGEHINQYKSPNAL